MIGLDAGAEPGGLDLDELPTWTSSSSTAPGRSRANGPTIAPDAISAPSICENERNRTLSATMTPGAEHDIRSTTTSADFVSAQRNTVSGAISVVPSASRGGAAGSGWPPRRGQSALVSTPSKSSSGASMRGNETVPIRDATSRSGRTRALRCRCRSGRAGRRHGVRRSP